MYEIAFGNEYIDMKIKVEWCRITTTLGSFKNRFSKAILRDIKKAMPQLFQ